MTRPWKTVLPTAGIVLAAAAALLSISVFSGDEEGNARPVADNRVAAVEGAVPAGELPVVTAHMSPTCMCCSGWAEHLEENGFEVDIRYTDDIPAVKAEHGVPADLTACHTAVVDGYIVEGHIPADVIQQLLQERPRVLGIAAPGMPRGSPGMEGPYPAERYEIISFDEDGERTVFAER